MIIGFLARFSTDILGAALIILYMFLMVYLIEKLIQVIYPIWDRIVQKTCSFFGFNEEKP
jgi:hypothetical protein